MTDTVQFSINDVSDILMTFGSIRHDLERYKKDVGLITIGDIKNIEKAIDLLGMLVMLRAHTQDLSLEQILDNNSARYPVNKG